MPQEKKEKTVLAIIGTAGRREDASKLTFRHWKQMLLAAKKIIELEKVTDLISGGAAWADHVAVTLSETLPTTIWLPAHAKDLDTTRYYHEKFSRAVGRETFSEIEKAKKSGNLEIKNFGGFKDRNTKVSEGADIFLAMTFGEGKVIKDGGTADTVRKLSSAGKKGYHLDLQAMKLYPIT